MLKKIDAKIIIFGILALLIIGGAFVLYKLQFKKEIQLKTEEKTGNINILLLGRGGGKHEAPNLTDTIIVATINPEKKMMNLVSIPRDLWSPDLQAKVNTAYSYGQDKDGQGKLLAKTILGRITGKQIDYVLVIDFSGYVKLVDHLGGIDVNVRNTLDDYKYPIEDKEDDPCEKTPEEIIDLSAQIATGSASETDAFPCRYKYIHFDKGVQHMNGETALEFVRSRHGVNGEGSDFARAQRQQDVINAIRDKSLSLGIILNPLKVLGAFNIIKDNIDTNARVTEIDDFINLANKMQGAKITSTVIDFGDEAKKRYGLLTTPSIGNAAKYRQWVLIPRAGDGNFSEIKEYLTCIEEGLVCEIGEEGIKRRR
ncbi:MAG: hypothetical protein A3G66_04175 [Candidatus Levybacteria bacterium RIFCSPLOWO2_12_FULL_39_17]|nr:MAG: cell envelope-related function transcriptional attenuator, LytR/CpsA family protein, nonfunctional [Candidatus Levybacteria bacterium GW2011_GWA1_39_11]OGH15411.1 MAG: hypothetical protein A2689_02780 [Candidatus Levybacteria bacterium RIFCSPHIGHO2_01_FULL_38_96]OGH36302.1 MAG: hypothetical protein A3B43_01845 [Candidatus Levybacteria bacterium RIFCSPLOWO2_01_FULL_38_120]OGH46882.1 MAG: hypothetical protein A3G66_04175 [Candidatus Levybacteria bacterium RIFCSPLOWO2_12_FULL_39_17]